MFVYTRSRQKDIRKVTEEGGTEGLIEVLDDGHVCCVCVTKRKMARME
jgi:hypothetical protein